MLSKIIFTFALVNFFLCLGGNISSANNLRVYYIEYPPYYFTSEKGEPDGFLLKKMVAIFEKIGIKCSYVSMPSKRILEDIKRGEMVASVGWFKTPERESYANFSKVIFANKPSVIIAGKEKSIELSQLKTLKNIMSSDKFVAGGISGHSEGEYIDKLFSEYPGNVQLFTAEQSRLVKLVRHNRIDFMIAPPEEVPHLIGSSDENIENFAIVEVEDIPKGNDRYMIFSKAIDDSIVEKFNNELLSN